MGLVSFKHLPGPTRHREYRWVGTVLVRAGFSRSLRSGGRDRAAVGAREVRTFSDDFSCTLSNSYTRMVTEESSQIIQPGVPKLYGPVWFLN